MNDEQYLNHCRGLLRSFNQDLAPHVGQLPADDPLCELATALANAEASVDALYGSGPALVSRLFTTYPELAPLFPRQLLWFLGGDCLHLMPDEEIAEFQLLEEERHRHAARGEVINFHDARAKLLK